MDKPIEGLLLKFKPINDGHRYDGEMYAVSILEKPRIPMRTPELTDEQFELMKRIAKPYRSFEGTIDVLRISDGDVRDGFTCSFCRAHERKYFDTVEELYSYIQSVYTQEEIDTMEYFVDEDPQSYDWDFE